MKNEMFYILFLFMMMVSHELSAQKDTLIMNTGEILVGEIKGFDEGVVVIETDYSDSDFKVEWAKVVSITTDHKFVLISSKGDRLFGRLVSDKENPSKVMITDEKAGNPVMNIGEIVFLKEVDDTFWSRVELKLSAGYTMTKANNNHQLSGNFKTGYMSSILKSDLSFGIIRSLQTSEDITTQISRTEGGLGFLFFIVRDWFAIARSDLLQSSEQKLNIRSITKGGAGHYIFKTNYMNLGGAVGAAWNYEDYNDPLMSDRNSAEAFAALEYKIFNLGDLDLLTRVVAYPSLTEKNRFRTDFNFNLEYEFEFDLFINLGFTLNYDNQPAKGASDNDYVFLTTIGWEL